MSSGASADDDGPTAGWVTFEDERLLIGRDPTFVLHERTTEETTFPSYRGEWRPNGEADDASTDVFEGRKPGAAWRAAVEICRGTKSRCRFEGIAWDGRWASLESDASAWSDRARDVEAAGAEEHELEGCTIEPVGGGVAVEIGSDSSNWLGSRVWEFSPEGLEERVRRFGIETGEQSVDRGYLAVVAIPATGGSAESCGLAVAGEGLYEEIASGWSLERAERLRHIVLRGLAGRFDGS